MLKSKETFLTIRNQDDLGQKCTLGQKSQGLPDGNFSWFVSKQATLHDLAAFKSKA